VAVFNTYPGLQTLHNVVGKVDVPVVSKMSQTKQLVAVQATHVPAVPV